MVISLLHKLIDACKEPGCPVCRLANQSAQRYLEHFFYESVNDDNLRQRLRTSHGFCKAHLQQAIDSRAGDVLGYSIIYHDILGSLLQHITETGVSSKQKSNPIASFPSRSNRSSELARKISQALQPEGVCLVCDHEQGSAASLLDKLTESLNDQRLTVALEQCDGLCMLHLSLAAGRVRSENDINILIDIHQIKLLALRAELAEFIRKNDYRFSSEEIGSERDAWKRAAMLINGIKP